MKKLFVVLTLILLTVQAFAQIKIKEYSYGLLYTEEKISDIYLESCKTEFNWDHHEDVQYRSTYTVINSRKKTLSINFKVDGENQGRIYVNGQNQEVKSNSCSAILKSGKNTVIVESTYYGDSSESLDGLKINLNSNKKDSWNTERFSSFSVLIDRSMGDVIITDSQEISGAKKAGKNFYCFSDGEKTLSINFSCMPEDNISFYGMRNSSGLYLNDNLDSYSSLITKDNLRLRSGPGTSFSPVVTILKGTAVKVIETGRAEKIDGIISNWVKVELTGNAKDKDGKPVAASTQGWCFGGYLTESYDFGFDEDLIKAFSESDSEKVPANAYYEVKNWIEKIYKLNAPERLLGYCEECMNRGYFSRSYNTMPNPLLVAVELNWMEAAELLIDKYPGLINLGFSSGKNYEFTDTPLLAAVSNNNLQIASLLIANGADVNCFLLYKELNPLDDNLLSYCKSPEMQKLLLENNIKQTENKDLHGKLNTRNKTTIRLFEKMDETSDFIEVIYEQDKKYDVTEAGFINIEISGSEKIQDYIVVNRWLKVTVDKNSGWVKPGEVYFPFYYYEP